jgi:hypothetical protein
MPKNSPLGIRFIRVKTYFACAPEMGAPVEKSKEIALPNIARSSIPAFRAEDAGPNPARSIILLQQTSRFCSSAVKTHIQATSIE